MGGQLMNELPVCVLIETWDCNPFPVIHSSITCMSVRIVSGALSEMFSLGDQWLISALTALLAADDKAGGLCDSLWRFLGTNNLTSLHVCSWVRERVSLYIWIKPFKVLNFFLHQRYQMLVKMQPLRYHLQRYWLRKCKLHPSSFLTGTPRWWKQVICNPDLENHYWI